MEAEIAALREEITTSRSEEKITKAALITMNATMSTRDLEAGILALGTQKKELLACLAPLRSGDKDPISVEVKKQVQDGWKMWNHNFHVRKKICLEVWDMVTQELPAGKTREELWVSKHPQYSSRKFCKLIFAIGRAWTGR